MGHKLTHAIVSLILAVLNIGHTYGQQAPVPTPTAVKQFYSGITAMSTCGSIGELGQLEQNMANCFFGAEDSGMNLPNDFRFFVHDKDSPSHELAILTSNNYISKLSEYIYNRRIMKPIVDISTHSMKAGALPSFGNGRMTSEDAYIVTIVRKTYQFSDYIHESMKKEFIDTIYTHVYQNKIRMIMNGNGITPSNPDRIRIKAANAYAEKRYKEAYELFNKLISINVNDGETYYHIALMTYYGKGCNKSHRKAKELMRKASRTAPSDIRKKAENILKYWQVPNPL